MLRQALIEALFTHAEATVVLDHDGSAACGFALLRRFGRGHVIGPVVAHDADGAKALIAHLSGLNAGRFTRIKSATQPPSAAEVVLENLRRFEPVSRWSA